VALKYFLLLAKAKKKKRIEENVLSKRRWN